MSKWPDGVPLPPKPQKPEGITDWEWDLYLDDDPTKHTELRAKYPHLRDKVEAALGWKKDDIADAREISEQIADIIAPLQGKGHVPEENLARYRRLRELSHLMSRMGDMAARLHEHADARTLWELAGKYKRMANELRVDLPGSGDTSPQP